MSSADVKRLHVANGLPVVVVGRGNKVVRSEVFENNPRITYELRVGQRLVNGPGVRPYILSFDKWRWRWVRDRDQQPGEIYLTNAERNFAAPYLGMTLIEPNVKATVGHTNKAWPFERWQAVVNEARTPMVQVGYPGTRWLAGVTKVETQTFRQACAVLSVSRAFVGTEGGLHHAAAALGVPAVVLWSHFIAPDVTGYATQKNIRHVVEACGQRTPCAECSASMARISVEEVADALVRLVESRVAA